MIRLIKPVKRRWIIPLLCCLAIGGCKKQAEETSDTGELVPVITQFVHWSRATRPLPCQGTVHPLRQATISFMASGTVSQIASPEGARVQLGDTLATLDFSLLTQEWVRRGLQLISERKRLAELNAAYQRGEISREEYESTKKKVALLVDIYYNAKSARRHFALTAPWKGRVVTWQVTQGSRVKAGQAAVIIADFDPQAIAQVHLTEAEYHRIQKGDSAVVVPIDKYDLPLGGVVHEKYLTDEPTGSPFAADILFENPGGAVPLGTEVTANIIGQWKEQTILIPKEALVEREGPDATVFLTDPKGKFAVRRRVLVGPEIGDQVIIDKGLGDGERLIVFGQSHLEQGTHILILQ